jgi:hypothetical protein
MTVLTDVSGIGSKKAESARENGYKTAESVAHANLLRLTEETDLLAEDVVSAQEYLRDEYPDGWTSKRYTFRAPKGAHCSDCGRRFTTFESPAVAKHEANCDGSRPTARRFA